MKLFDYILNLLSKFTFCLNFFSFPPTFSLSFSLHFLLFLRPCVLTTSWSFFSTISLNFLFLFTYSISSLYFLTQNSHGALFTYFPSLLSPYSFFLPTLTLLVHNALSLSLSIFSLMCSLYFLTTYSHCLTPFSLSTFSFHFCTLLYLSLSLY